MYFSLVTTRKFFTQPNLDYADSINDKPNDINVSDKFECFY